MDSRLLGNDIKRSGNKLFVSENRVMSNKKRAMTERDAICISNWRIGELTYYAINRRLIAGKEEEIWK